MGSERVQMYQRRFSNFTEFQLYLLGMNLDFFNRDRQLIRT